MKRLFMKRPCTQRTNVGCQSVIGRSLEQTISKAIFGIHIQNDQACAGIDMWQLWTKIASIMTRSGWASSTSMGIPFSEAQALRRSLSRISGVPGLMSGWPHVRKPGWKGKMFGYSISSRSGHPNFGVSTSCLLTESNSLLRRWVMVLQKCSLSKSGTMSRAFAFIGMVFWLADTLAWRLRRMCSGVCSRYEAVLNRACFDISKRYSVK